MTRGEAGARGARRRSGGVRFVGCRRSASASSGVVQEVGAARREAERDERDERRERARRARSSTPAARGRGEHEDVLRSTASGGRCASRPRRSDGVRFRSSGGPAGAGSGTADIARKGTGASSRRLRPHRPRQLVASDAATATVYTRTGDDGTTGLLLRRPGRQGHDRARRVRRGRRGRVGARPRPGRGRARLRARRAARAAAARAVRRRRRARDRAREPRASSSPACRSSPPRWSTRSSRSSTTSPRRYDPPQEFVLPGENRVAAALDLARTVVRRAERRAVAAARRRLARPSSAGRALPQPARRPRLHARPLAGGHVPARARRPT